MQIWINQFGGILGFVIVFLGKSQFLLVVTIKTCYLATPYVLCINTQNSALKQQNTIF